ncbi:MAG: glycosyltransferase family 39 protein [Dehalococcoidia bacterium]
MINSQSFWYDEAYTASIIRNSYWDLWLGNVRDHGNPPLYWILAKAWSQLFGSSEIGLRSLSVFLGVCSIPALAVLGRKLLSKEAGLIASGLLAVSPWAVALSNEARTYVLLMLLSVICTLLFVKLREKPHPVYFCGYALSTFLVWHSHYFAFFIPLAHGLACLTDADNRKKCFLLWSLAVMLSVCLWLYWAPSSIKQMIPRVNSARRDNFYQFLATPLVFSYGRTLVWRENSLVLLAAASIVSLFTFGTALCYGCLKLLKDKFALVLFVSWCGIPVAGPFFLALLGKQIYQVRYAYVGYAAFLLLVAWGLLHLARGVRQALLVVVVVMTAISLGKYTVYPIKDDWRSATNVVMANADEDELFLFDKANHSLAFRYYAERYGFSPKRVYEVLGVSLAEKSIMIKLASKNMTSDSSAEKWRDTMGSSSFWLILRTPIVASWEEYESLFKDLGFKVSERYSFYRISVYHFRRIAGQ